MFTGAESVLTAKIVFETVAAVSGFAKEGIGLAEKLRERKNQLRPLLLKLSSDGENSSALAIKAINELYDSLRDSRPHVRRIVKRRIVLRIQVLIGVLAGIAFGSTYWHTDWIEEIKKFSGYSNSPWIGGFSAVVLFLICGWLLQIGEFRFADKFNLSEERKYIPFWDKLPPFVRAPFSAIIEKVWFQERTGLTISDRMLLVEYGKLSGLVEVLESQALAQSCSFGAFNAAVYLKKELDECVFLVLKDAAALAKANPNADAPTLVSRLPSIYQEAGIGEVCNQVRYKAALVRQASEYDEGGKDDSIFWNTLKNEDVTMFRSAMIESGRLTAAEIMLSGIKRVGKAAQYLASGATPED